MNALPASRLEKIVMILMHRLGRREVHITGEEVQRFLELHPDASLDHSYERIRDELTVKIGGVDLEPRRVLTI